MHMHETSADPPTTVRPGGSTSGTLTFDRTVPRQMVHRAAVAEVFVTDAEHVAEWQVRVAVQLPPSHAYYGDHAGDHVDPLLLLEAARQAGIYGAHVLGVPATSTMLISVTTLRVTRPDLLKAAEWPIRLVVSSTFESRRPGTKRAFSGVVTQRFELDGTVVGTLCLEALVMTQDQHAAVRSIVRTGPVPTTDRMPDGPHPEALRPDLVGRTHPANVVLAAARSGPGGHSALVAPRFGNRALFDHVYDHLPGAVLAEAARQLAVYATGRPDLPVVGIDARYPRFAELDLPVVASTPVIGVGTTQIPVTFTQDGTEVTSVVVTVCPQQPEAGGAR